MNPYLKNVNKVEFVLTDACTGRCRHCSQGKNTCLKNKLDPVIAGKVVREICSVYDIKTVMTFGGEPMLNSEAVYAVHRAAYGMNVPVRQLITNGFFTDDPEKIRQAATMLSESGVNDVLLSVDAFHQEYIPLEPVIFFAKELMNLKVSVRIQPAWLVNRDDNNPYNIRTKKLLAEFSDLGVKQNDGNVVFPEGNALVYLKEYFEGVGDAVNPYIEDPENIKTISISADGSVLGGNVNHESILEIIKRYIPV